MLSVVHATAADLSWSLAPGPLVLVLVLTYVYVRRWRTVHAKEGERGAPVWRLCSFAGGIVCLVVALVSPVDALAEQLFFMHMVQHVLLLDVVPILLILGLTRMILRPVARQVLDIERALGPIAHPAFAVVFYVAAMGVWHIPALYDAALEHSGIHVIEHVFFLTAGGLYWWHLLSPVRRTEMHGLTPVIYMVATKVLVGIIGIIITFAPDPLYAFYENGPRVWGIGALDDQAAAGAIMALEQSIIMGIALAALFIRALGEADRADERAERLEHVGSGH